MVKRRLFEDDIEYIFSASNTSITIGSGSLTTYVNITSTANGENTPYEILSYDGFVSNVTQTITSSVNRINISCSANTTISNRTSLVVLKLTKSNKIINIVITLYGVTPTAGVDAILLDRYGSGSTTLNVTDGVSVLSQPSWVNASVSNGTLSVSANYWYTSTETIYDYGEIKVGNNDVSTTIKVVSMPTTYPTIDGYQYITMTGNIGSLKVAILNVGANSVTDYGKYYQFARGAAEHVPNYYLDDDYSLSNDTARLVMGGEWYTPSKVLAEAIICGTNERMNASYNGVKGLAIYDSTHSKCLFLPGAGYKNLYGTLTSVGVASYMTSTSPNSSQFNYMGHPSRLFVQTMARLRGVPVRGVHD